MTHDTTVALLALLAFAVLFLDMILPVSIHAPRGRQKHLSAITKTPEWK